MFLSGIGGLPSSLSIRATSRDALLTSMPTAGLVEEGEEERSGAVIARSSLMNAGSTTRHRGPQMLFGFERNESNAMKRKAGTDLSIGLTGEVPGRALPSGCPAFRLQASSEQFTNRIGHIRLRPCDLRERSCPQSSSSVALPVLRHQQGQDLGTSKLNLRTSGFRRPITFTITMGSAQ